MAFWEWHGRRGGGIAGWGTSGMWHSLQDGKLTREEIVDKSDLFVGSQATDFGEALVRHDEF